MQPILTVHTNRLFRIKGEVYFSLVLRSILFLVFGLIFVGIFTMQGSDHPFQDAEKWWGKRKNILVFTLKKAKC
jgi:hypothetical protein